MWTYSATTLRFPLFWYFKWRRKAHIIVTFKVFTASEKILHKAQTVESLNILLPENNCLFLNIFMKTKFNAKNVYEYVSDLYSNYCVWYSVDLKIVSIIFNCNYSITRIKIQQILNQNLYTHNNLEKTKVYQMLGIKQSLLLAKDNSNFHITRYFHYFLTLIKPLKFLISPKIFVILITIYQFCTTLHTIY